MRKPTGKPCSECPFRRKSLAGYTGAQAPAEFLALAINGETPLPCHLKVDYEDKGWEDQLGDVPQCSGHAIFLGHTGKRPRNPDVAVLGSKPPQVFDNTPELLKHHRVTVPQLQRAFVRLMNNTK
jgi:hypothetical protein